MSDRWSQIKDVFQQALERRGGDRERFLDQACAEDPAMRTEVESLLEAHLASGDFLEHPPSKAAAAVVGQQETLENPARGAIQPGADLVGRRLGSYEIRERVARGGIGEVYRAVRDDDFRKEVAVKVIRQGMATEDVLRRFRDERQILAAIEHPNIARLLDGGTTDEGFPYLVMELIDGVPIDRYCDEGKLGLRARLELFRSLCEAVQVAHQNLVVHRDIKPGNIMVDKTGTPKLLDFGIAKILGDELGTEPAGATQIGHRMLTPEYASPEQLLGVPVTTTTDVYSLGVLLFQLLTGRRPFEPSDSGTAAMARFVAETRPTRPSEVVGQDGETAALRSTTFVRLRRALTGDLDNIVLKALRKEPERRYRSVEHFAEDIRRYLVGLPVTARPDTFGYRTGKFLSRHRLAVGLGAAILISLITFLSILASQAGRLARARNLAENEASRARVVSRFLQEVLANPDPFQGRLPQDATVVESLQAAVPRIDAAFSGEPLLEAEVRHTIGLTFLGLARYDDARSLLERALEIRLELDSTPAAARIASLEATGRLRQALGEYEEAERLYRQALELSRQANPPDSAPTATALNQLATARHDLGDAVEAEKLYRESLAMRRRLFGDDHPDVATSLDDLGNLLHDRGELETAESMYREALESRRRLLGPDHPDLAVSINNVGVVLHDQDRLGEAEELYLESLELTRRVFGDEHPDVAASLNNLAGLMDDLDRPDRAETLYREALAITRTAFGGEHPAIADQLANLGSLLHEKGQLDEAESLLRQAAEMSRHTLGDSHLGTAVTLETLADILLDRDDLAAAEGLMREALAISRRARPGDTYATAVALDSLARVLGRKGEPSAATDHLADALGMLERLDEDPELIAEIRTSYGGYLIEIGRLEEAEHQLESAHLSLERVAGPDDPRTIEAARLLRELAGSSTLD